MLTTAVDSISPCAEFSVIGLKIQRRSFVTLRHSPMLNMTATFTPKPCLNGFGGERPR